MKKIFALLLIFTFGVLGAAERDPFVDELADLAKMRNDDGNFFYSSERLKSFYFTIERKVLYADEKIVSYEITVQGDTGGAHRFTQITVGSIDRATGKELTLDDIAPGAKLAELDRAIKDALIKQRNVKDFKELMKQLQHEPKPTENFYFADDGLHFIYNTYEIACFADGSFDVVVPWKR